MAHEITLCHLNASRSQRLFWILEELGQPYNVKVFFRQPTKQAPPELKEVSPYGKAPVLILDGETITESGYIVSRLLEISPSSADVETKPSHESTFWSHFSEGSMMNLFQAGAAISASGAAWAGGQVGGLDEHGRAGVKKYVEWLNEGYLRPQNQDNIDSIEKYLSSHSGKFFSGTDKPGAGDFMMFFAIHSLLSGSRKDAGYKIGPATKAWFDMVMARPACKKGLERLAKEEETAAKAKM